MKLELTHISESILLLVSQVSQGCPVTTSPQILVQYKTQMVLIFVCESFVIFLKI